MNEAADSMGVLTGLLVLFVWLKVGGVVDLSWWWILLPVGVCLVDGFVGGMIDEFRKGRVRRRFIIRAGRR